MAKYILIRSIRVVNCPKYGRIIPVHGVNVPKTEPTCSKCDQRAKETCNYIKCNYPG